MGLNLQALLGKTIYSVYRKVKLQEDKTYRVEITKTKYGRLVGWEDKILYYLDDNNILCNCTLSDKAFEDD